MPQLNWRVLFPSLDIQPLNKQNSKKRKFKENQEEEIVMDNLSEISKSMMIKDKGKHKAEDPLTFFHLYPRLCELQLNVFVLISRIPLNEDTKVNFISF